MTKILFLIHDLGHGGAEKVLVNLVNNLDRSKFDISVTVLFGGGVNEQFLRPDVHFRAVFPKAFPGNSHIMKLLTPKQLHALCVKEHYDIEVSYLEGPSARIISGCDHPGTKLVSWTHCTMSSLGQLSRSFRSQREAIACYSRFHANVFVSQSVRNAFLAHCPLDSTHVLYNTNESSRILALADEPVEAGLFRENEIRLVGVGKLEAEKGFDRLARIHRRLIREGFPVHTCILGQGSKHPELTAFIRAEQLEDSFTLLGYRTNPYKYVANCDLFVCASHAEGFSTAATEALIVGTPVCSVEVSGMREMLGQHNEWGIVTENSEEALYRAIKDLLQTPAKLAHYKTQAALRGQAFQTNQTVKAVEDMLLGL